MLVLCLVLPALFSQLQWLPLFSFQVLLFVFAYRAQEHRLH
jgi:hypothetical protein